MDFWNCRKLQAPPTYTYKAPKNEIDVNYLKNILQDGIKFYKEQQLFDLETALIARIIYRMKRKFHNSKDFKLLEKVRRNCVIHSEINISQKLQHLLSLLPEHSEGNEMFLPTKNMVDYILVLFQGIGKVLCRSLALCKRTLELYELRMKYGHFWRLALIVVSLVSRVYVLSLNIIKYTCLFHVRLLPFSNHLKNSGVTNWLPKNYTLPKDLKEWLNISWVETEEMVVEIPEENENDNLFNLVEDSDDDDVQFYNEYVEIKDDEELEIFGDFKNIKPKKIQTIDFDKSLTQLRGFVSKDIDVGEELIEENGENQVEDVPTEKEELRGEKQTEKAKFRSKKRSRWNTDDVFVIPDSPVVKKKKIVDEKDESVIVIPNTPSSVLKANHKKKKKNMKSNENNLFIIDNVGVGQKKQKNKRKGKR